ncbi:MAG: LpqB family beta-propeller domain-containing protein [Acidobacteriota bacterium]
MNNGSNDLYEFGSFRLDARGLLLRGDEVVPLSPKAVELLKFLIERPGQVMSKQEIFDNVWANTFVEDGVLTQNIYTLRNALGLDENGKQFIETVPRRGYRFAAAVKAVFPDELTLDPAEKEFLYGEDGSQTKSRTGSLLRAILFTFAIIACVGVLWFGIYELILKPKSPSKQALIEQVHLQRLTDTGDILYPTISPDGETLAFVRSGENEQTVWVQQTATGSSVQTLPPSQKGYGSLAYSPDGRYLFFRETPNGGSIFQVATLGGTPRHIADNVWSDLCLSPDGKRIAFVRHETVRDADILITAAVDGGGEKEMALRRSPESFSTGPAWSPDGEKIVIAVSSQDDPVKLVSVSTASLREETFTTPKWRFVASMVWMPNGREMIVSARDVKEAVSQIWMLDTVAGETRRLTNDLENYYWVSRTADGQKIVTRQQHIVAHLWVLPDGDPKKGKQLTSGVRNLDGYLGLAWTADGNIIYSSRSGQVTDLYLIDGDGGDPVQMTANAGQDNTYPSLSRNGHIIFTSNRGGTPKIWQMDADGREQHPIMVGDNENERVQWPTFSPDGRAIFFLKRSDSAAIWKVPSDGGEPALAARISNGSADGPLAISPDGKWLAYHHLPAKPLPAVGEDRTQQIGVISLDGDETKLFDLPVRRPIVQWITSNSFDYSAGSYNSSSLVRQSLAGGERQKLFDLPDRVFNFAWSPDGKTLAISRGQLQGDALLITNLVDGELSQKPGR